jgi:hypothetical protein
VGVDKVEGFLWDIACSALSAVVTLQVWVLKGCEPVSPNAVVTLQVWVHIGVNIEACHLPPNAVVTLQVWMYIGGGAYVSDLQSLTRATRRATIKHIYTDIYICIVYGYLRYV